MKCIFCLEEKSAEQLSIEHVFPESIGGTFVIKNVCIKCNSDLGAFVDSHLVDHYVVTNSCHTHSIKNKNGIVPSPFPNTSLLSGTNEKVNYEFDDNGKPIGLYKLPFRELDEKAGKLHVKLDARDKDKLVEVINKITDRKGLPRLSREEIEKNTYKGSIKQPSVHYTTTFDTCKYIKGIIKIAYELSCVWLGNYYLDDKEGLIIRNYIQDRHAVQNFSERYPIKGTVGLIMERSPGNIFDYKTFYHLGYLFKERGDIIAYIRILDSFEGIIKMSTSASNYNFDRNFIAIDPVSGDKYEEIKFRIKDYE